MPYTIGIDIGGTFTDAFATDELGNVVSAKSSSTPPDFERGVLDSLTELAAEMDTTLQDLLPQVTYICHGTTSSLNALVTGNVAPVGFLTTRGHADSTYIMNVEGRYAGLGPDKIQDIVSTQKPRPLISKRQVREITERIDHRGNVLVALDEDAARKSIRELGEDGVEAIAVSLLWSFSNSVHERRLQELIEEELPGMYVGLSSELSPRIREYARSSTTIMSAQVGPPLQAYLEPLDATLRDHGFAGSLLVMQGSGGSIAAEEAPRHAITTVGSILTGGVIGCQTLGSTLDHDNIISTDMGGTTFLVGLVVNGAAVTSPTSVLNQYTINVPMVKVAAIGSGGGAIARLDAGGNLRVGPQSAGASPGPACYSEGGTEPTITDADVVLGIINPDNFLGGKKQLDAKLAEEAIRARIAEPLGMDVVEAASAIYTIAAGQATDLIRREVVNQGRDPRDFAIYAFGGAAPAHCAAYTRDLGAKAVIVPLGSTAATFSAYGLSASNVVLSGEVSAPSLFPVSAAEFNAPFAQIETRLKERLAQQKVEFSEVKMVREVDMRYSMQLAEVSTPVADGVLDKAQVAAVGDDFEALYERLYGEGAGFSDAGIQIITYRVFATGVLPFRPNLPEIEPSTGELQPVSVRPVHFSADVGWQDTPIFDSRALRAGDELTGPAVIEAPTTTVALLPDTAATVDMLGNLSITFT